MKTLNIPQKHQESVKYFLNLDNDTKESIYSVIKKSEIGEQPSVLIERFTDANILDKEHAIDIVSLLYSLIGAKEGLEIEEDDEFNELLISAFKRFEEKIENPEKAAEDLIALLNNTGSNITLTRTAVNALLDSQKNISEVILHEDIRPIFSKKEDKENVGFILLHRLKIIYIENGEKNELYFSLNCDDLKKIKESIILAEERTKILKENSGLNFIDLE